MTFQRGGASEQCKDVLRQVSMQRIFKMQANIGQLNNSKSCEPICFERGKRYVFTLSTDWIYGDWRLSQCNFKTDTCHLLQGGQQVTKGNRWKHAAKECREQELQRPNDTKGWQNKTKTLS